MSDPGANARLEVGRAMAEAAGLFVDVLDQDQRDLALVAFDDGDSVAGVERRTWFYTPADHGGLALAAMSADQQRRAHRLLATGLSRAGYVTAATIMGLENVLDHTEGWTAGFGRERGRDPLLYWVTIFGTPGERAWGWRFGGHHISLHYTILDGAVAASTPNFFGADPASSPLLGPHLLRPLAAAEDLGRDLVQALAPDQRRRTIVSPRAPIDVVTVNRARLSDGDYVLPLPTLFRGRLPDPFDQLMADAHAAAETNAGLTPGDVDAVSFTTTPKGLAVASFSSDQREILRSLLDAYLDRMPDGLAELEKRKYEGAGLDQLSFLWAGGIEPGQPHYYRVQGAQLLVEYDNTQRGVNHVHTVWRDLADDFGGSPLVEHYRKHDHRKHDHRDHDHRDHDH